VSFLARWLRRGPDSEAALAARRLWSALPAPSPRAPIDALRFVAVDTETSGLDPARDRLISIGACAVEAGALRVGESFQALLRQERPSAPENVLLHGIGHNAQAAGMQPDQALAAFLAFARRNVLVGYHTLFDVTVLARAMRGALAIRYRPVSLDLALLLPGLEGGGAEWELDRWLARYGLRAFSRHDALADATAAAELLLVALQRSASRRRQSLGDLLRLQDQQLALKRFASAG
jgi:DNA polymerase-3 subunit epsilon